MTKDRKKEFIKAILENVVTAPSSYVIARAIRTILGPTASIPMEIVYRVGTFLVAYAASDAVSKRLVTENEDLDEILDGLILD